MKKLSKFFRRKPKQSSHPTSEEDLSISVLENCNAGSCVIQNASHCTELSEAQWRQILTEKSFNSVPHSALVFSMFKGLPDQFRMKIWKMLSNTDSHPLTTEVYQTLNTEQLDQHKKSQIQKDVHRSFVKNEQYLYLKPQLRRLLFMVGLQPLGYAQGMNFIALHVLIFCLESERGKQSRQLFESPEFERNVLCILLHIFETLKDIYSSDATGIFQTIAELEHLIVANEPDVLYHIGKCGFECVGMFSPNYYSLMMSGKPPHSLAKSILDLYLLEGRRAIHSMILKMLQICSPDLLATDDPMDVQRILKSDMFQICADRMLQEKSMATNLQDFCMSYHEETRL